jgi:biopolymer transport protein ExbB
MPAEKDVAGFDGDRPRLQLHDEQTRAVLRLNAMRASAVSAANVASTPREPYHSRTFGMKFILPLLVFAASATSLFAQAPAPASPDLPRSTSILDAMMNAGPVMIPLFALSVFSLMLVIVYFLTIRRGAVVSSGYMATADALLRKRDYLGLLAVSNRHGESIARVVQKMLEFTTKNPGADFQQVREIAETEGTRVASSLNNRVIYLADIGMIAPLIGLLGTVIGIVRSFSALGADLGSARYMQLSKGVSEALINTAGGLAIGIPAMIFYAFFRGRAQRLISDLESAVTHVLALLSLQYDKRSSRAPALVEDDF